MSKLFNKINIGQMTLKNRIIMSAMDLGFTSDGTINDQIINFYIERAKGGLVLLLLVVVIPR